ncbi:MAG: UDP-N-acetylmuramate dehydrogenase, partial [Anaerolineaceae bacterium]|nr:UDP-N-acetylmuramate dehydrogenase [Anaerolineaceae bacterium]
MIKELPFDQLRDLFGDHLQENVVMANYTTAHVGGPASALIPVNSCQELERAARSLWELKLPFKIIGSGANVLFSDRGYPGVILVNHAHTIKIDSQNSPPMVWAESGANLGSIARQSSLRGLSGMEWAATIPGTLGGAVYGNAGAQELDMASVLISVDVLLPGGEKQTWKPDQLGFQYRSSVLKRERAEVVILCGNLILDHGDVKSIQMRMEEFSKRRRSSQPPGASMGSTFKNPPNDFAGRLIEAAGLKGKRVGDVEVSPQHANFFVNSGHATAQDYYELIQLVQKKVA